MVSSQSDQLVVEARALGSFFGASATKKWTITDWKVSVSKPAPIHGEHQSPAQWLHTRIFPGEQNWFSNRGPLPKPTTNQTSNRLSPKPKNDKQLTNQNTGRCCHHARKSCPLRQTQSTGKGHGETGFARVFGHQRSHKFRRKTQFIFGYVNGQAHAQAFVKNG